MMTAFHALRFNFNIIASHDVSKHFKVVFFSTLFKEKICVFLRLGSAKLENVFWKGGCENGLYPVDKSLFSAQAVVSKVPNTKSIPA